MTRMDREREGEAERDCRHASRQIGRWMDVEIVESGWTIAGGWMESERERLSERV